MATTPKKRSKKSKATRTASRVESISQLKKTIATQEKTITTQVRELREGTEQQAATSEILRVISASPTDLQPVFDTIAESSMRLCGALFSSVYRFDGELIHMVAHRNYPPAALELSQRIFPTRPRRQLFTGRAILERAVVNVPDVRRDLEWHSGADREDLIRLDQEVKLYHGASGFRSVLSVPMLRGASPIGAITVWHPEVGPFSDKQIALLKTFADQAVIAIENARLFQESQTRNRDLSEALEQQTATSEVLRVIAGSPTELQPVLDTVIANAVTLAGANHGHIRQLDGEFLRLAAHYNESPEQVATIQATPVRVSQSLAGRAFLEGRPIQSLDAREDPNFGRGWSAVGARSLLAVPLLRKGTPIGNILIWRDYVEPFTERQIELVKTFADQAVIAIENTRLFRELQERNAELREALEHQTATAEVLSIISRSPTDVQPVLDAIVESAARVCGIDDVLLRLHEGELRVPRAHFGPIPIPGARAEISIDEPQVHWMREHGTLHIPDVRAQNDFPNLGVVGRLRSFLSVPLRQKGDLFGTLTARRTEVRPFTPAQIKLLETFADQAVIAIENVRLFNELKESLEQQTATSEILGVIASSPTDIQPVLNAVAVNAARLCEATDAQIRLVEENGTRLVASFGTLPTAPEFRPTSLGSPSGRAILQRQTMHIHDLSAAVETEFPEGGDIAKRTGTRTFLSTPMLREGTPIGLINIRRTEVRPFSDRQIKLLETFAHQAVIAIENVRLFKELETRNRDLSEALEQQTATSKILEVIASSPTDIQPVLEAIAESATRLCDAYDAGIGHVVGDILRLNAHSTDPSRRRDVPITRGHIGGEAILDRRTVHIHDLAAEENIRASSWINLGVRTVLFAPLLREGTAIGAIALRRMEVRPFTEKQIALLETFANQAVIAIENVRLFRELQERNAELREALEHQTATAEVLGIISRSPTDVQPVLDAIVESAAQVCGIDDVVLRLRQGDVMTVRAHFGHIPPGRPEISVDEAQYRWIRDHGALHIPDIHAQSDFPGVGTVGNRTYLAVPLHQQQEFIGVLAARHMDVHPFSPAQIKLFETFADQAVIAIENVRLFQELKESLEQQTATSEIFGVIASSPTDIQPVLDVVAENAARVCGATDATIAMQIEGGLLRKVAGYGTVQGSPIGTDFATDRNNVIGRAFVDRETIHVHDFLAVASDYAGSRAPQHGYRTMLGTPLLREGMPIGVIAIRRTEVQPFTDKQISLLKTFADQAVIAIENIRLFHELQQRNRDLTEALEQQTATSEILRVIASSPTDLQPVFQTILDNAVRLCEAQNGAVFRFDGQLFRAVVWNNISSALSSYVQNTPIPPGRESALRRVGLEKRPVHIPDMLADPECIVPESYKEEGMRSNLAVPLLKENDLIGAIAIHRREVRPFTENQIKLLETFASQAVIAIENVRLFQELKESLEQQTATSEILGVIASSPTDIQPVLDVVAENAARLCDALDAAIYRIDGEHVQPVAHCGPVPLGQAHRPLARGLPTGRAILDRQTVHIHDLVAVQETEFPDAKPLQPQTAARTCLATPLLREGVAIGAIFIRRTEVRPFTEKQIKLLETFAAQAVIAIENVRLFKELDERTNELTRSVGELKALGEVGQAVSSTLDLETVLTSIVSHAVQLSGTDGGAIYEYDEHSEEFLLRATDHMEEELISALRANPPRIGDGVVGRAAASREPVQVPNILEERTYAPRMREMLERFGFRASLAVPLLREDRIIGGLVVRRKLTSEFRPEVIELLKTFATQSVLAIQNARLFREIEDKSKQIEAANRHKSEFLANMSHELRTPLNAIIGFSEVLGERMFGELNEKQAEYTDDILSSGRHLLSLINEILDLSKVEAGRMELEVATFDLPLAIDNARTFVRERAAKHGINLDVTVDERLGDFVGDERKIKQVLLNLLSNAVKFTPEGGRIGINARQTDGSVEISVSDTGIGIAPEDQPKIFEEFRQVGSDYAHKVEGTGLGLTLAKKFVELHGGRSGWRARWGRAVDSPSPCRSIRGKEVKVRSEARNPLASNA